MAIMKIYFTHSLIDNSIQSDTNCLFSHLSVCAEKVPHIYWWISLMIGNFSAFVNIGTLKKLLFFSKLNVRTVKKIF